MAMKAKTAELVEIMRKQPFTNSLVIAEGTNNEHRAILQLIRKHEEKLERWGKVGFRISNAEKNRDNRGRPTQVAYLNEQQATFLVTLLKNTDIVVDFKAELVDQFYKMGEVIKQWEVPAWQEIRGEVKVTFRKLTDVIRDELIPLARSQGSTAPDDRFYMSWSMMLCKIGWYNPKSRDKLTLTHLGALNQMQDIAVDTLHGIIERGEANYKEIFQLVKAVLLDYARIARITERFAPKELLAA